MQDQDNKLFPISLNILITCLPDNVHCMDISGEVTYSSLLGVNYKRVKNNFGSKNPTSG